MAAGESQYVMNGKIALNLSMNGLFLMAMLTTYPLTGLMSTETMNHLIADGQQQKNKQIIEELIKHLKMVLFLMHERR